MNKTELKNFAVSARRDLLEKVALRAKIFGIDEKNTLIIEDKFGQLAINGETYSNDKKSAFLSLIKQLETKGYKQLIEEVAYTWFNRIIAIRYMEVNDYLPERVNVLSSSSGKVEPDILSQFETMDLNIGVDTIKALIKQGETEDAYRKLFIAQCNALNPILPFMFEKIQDYTELLLPDFLLDSESVINQLVSNDALTESFSEVEVIGWLYQFYNSEPKDKVFANLKKNKKIEKYDIPAVTQLFTPKWIVQYMVENSLGQLWLESSPNSPLKDSMKYYIEPAEQDEEVKQKLEEIRYKNVTLEEITIIDPCVGSGHILVYAFDLLYQMYEEAGYPNGDIPQLILEKNLFGLDIDDRAAQLASFALMMKAREKSRRIFRKQLDLNIYAIQESNHLDKIGISKLIGDNAQEQIEIQSFIESFIDAKNFGSILQPPNINYESILRKIEMLGEAQLSVDTFEAFEQIPKLRILLKQGKVLASVYDISITNPPYIGGKNMNVDLNNFIRKYFNNSKADLFAVFLQRQILFTKQMGLISTINQQSWMFQESFESLRKSLLNTKYIISMLHLGGRTFEEISGEVVQSTSFTIRNLECENYLGTYFRLVNQNSTADKEKTFLNKENIYFIKQSNFKKIPGMPLAYWISKSVTDLFLSSYNISDLASPRVGLQTGDNDKFLRLWFEVDTNKIGFNMRNSVNAANSKKKWFPYNKGGSFRRWYGNKEYLVNWESDGKEIRNFTDEKGKLRSRPQNREFYFKEGITWSDITTGLFSGRFTEKGSIFDTTGKSMFAESNRDNLFLTGFVNSKVFQVFLEITATGMHYNNGIIAQLPLINLDTKNDIILNLVSQNISVSKNDWNFFETSWDFECHPFLSNSKENNLLMWSFNNWTNYLRSQFEHLKANEEELNRLFIDLYNLQDELASEVPDEEITIRKPERGRDSKSFLSYFIGCVMGRYSLDIKGLAYAGGDWDDLKYKTFKPQKFGLIQLTDEHYFKDDIIARLRDFLSVTFGSETVEENLQWLAESLELKRNETAEERLRRYFLDEFFKDHCQVYQKRPIYWLVDSGKEKGLRTLIYMHRYQPDTMATIRFEHLQEIQAKYNNGIAAVDLRVVNPNLSATEKRDLEKQKTVYQKRLEELLDFDKKLAEYANAQIAIDLDDGVKVNYAKFDKVLAKIK